MSTEKIVNIAILTTENDETIETIIQHFEPFINANITCVITNSSGVTLSNKIRRYKTPIYKNITMYKQIDQILTHHNIHYIVLSNYLDKIPVNFCKKYQYKMINLQSSLLPIGEGLYGEKLFNSIKNSGSDITGISVHFVEPEYNTGTIIFKKEIKIDDDDTVDDIRLKTKTLENQYYPIVIEKTIKGTYKQLYEKEEETNRQY